MFDFQVQEQSFDVTVDQYGATIQFTFSFDGTVRHATVAIQAFEVHYADTDHYIKDLNVSAHCYDDPGLAGSNVVADLKICLKDKSNNRHITGTASLVALVDRDPSYIRLRCQANHRYVSAVDGGGGQVVVDSVDGHSPETFEVIGKLESHRFISLRTADGHHYLQLPPGRQPLNAQAPWSKKWETFEIIRIPDIEIVHTPIRELDQVTLRTDDGFLVLDPNTGRLAATTTVAEQASVFEVHVL